MTQTINSENLEKMLTPALQGMVHNNRYAGICAQVWQHDEPVYQQCCGYADREAGVPISPDQTILRFYSMTKPIMAAAMAILWDRGEWQIDDPVSKYIPEFADARVLGGEPLASPMTLRHLFTHTAGLSYGEDPDEDAVDAVYVKNGINDLYEGRWDPNLEEFIPWLAQQPLAFEAGTAYRYGFSTDVLGRVAEVITGQSLDDFLHEALFEPLGMVDTAFIVTDDKLGRFAPMYSPTDEGGLKLSGISDALQFVGDVRFREAGGGLTGTLADHVRFQRMLLRRGELDGVRVLSPQAVEYIWTNHMPQALIPFRKDYVGCGYGLANPMRVSIDPAMPWDPVGRYFKAGMASTTMWLDPLNDIFGCTVAQRVPADYAGGNTVHQMVYQSNV